MSSLLIVESENDKLFVERLIRHLNISELEIEPPICAIDDYECLDGLSNLKYRLGELSRDAKIDRTEKIGILIDADQAGINQRIKLINEAVQNSLDETIEINQTNQWFWSEKLQMNFACHILNVNGCGELETILKLIASKQSIFADCLKSWKECLDEENLSVREKDFDKFWVQVYQRYDACVSQKEKKQAGKRCNFKASLEKEIWDFDHDCLNGLKDFLRMFDSKKN